MTHEECKEYIEFDMDKIYYLQSCYEGTLSILKDNLPSVNINSRTDIINFFNKAFNIELKSTKIVEIASHIKKYGENSEEKELIQAIVYYFKLKYAYKNYIQSILKHEVNGQVRLRWYFGKLAFPNRQPLPYSMEILDCVTGGSEIAMNIIEANKRRNIL